MCTRVLVCVCKCMLHELVCVKNVATCVKGVCGCVCRFVYMSICVLLNGISLAKVFYLKYTP